MVILYMLRDPLLEAEISKRYRVEPGVRVPKYPQGLQLLRSLSPRPGAVIIADGLALNHSEGDLVGTVHEIRSQYRDVTVVVVTEDPNLHVREAHATVFLRLGKIEEAVAEIGRVLGLEERRGRRAWTVGVISNKGGEGKTTVAVGTALAMRELSRREGDKARILIVDLDLSDGNVAHSLGLDGDLPDLMALFEAERLTEACIREHIVPVQRFGVDALLAPLEVGAFLRVDSRELVQLRARLVDWYDVIVFDHNSDLTAKLNLVNLAACDRIVAVMTPTRYGVEGMRRLIPALATFVETERVRIVLNMALPEDRALVRELEREFGVRVIGAVPTGEGELRAFRQAQACGYPIPMRGRVWKEFRTIAEQLLEEMP